MAKTIDPNRKVNLDELRTLEKAKREVNRQLTEAEKRFNREKAAVKTARRNVKGALSRIGRRVAILNGRLSA